MMRSISARRFSLAIVSSLALMVPALAQPNNKAQLKILLPSLDTQVEIQGVAQKMPATPRDMRLFISPDLEPGKNYEYDVRITWTKDGQKHSVARTVHVRAGQTTDLDLRNETEQSTGLTPLKPMDLPPDKPAEKPGDKPADKPVDKPADKPLEPLKPNEPPKPNERFKPAEPPTPSFVAPPQEVVDFMLDFANVGASDVVYDLGSGDGRIAMAAVMKHKARKAVGVEHNSDRVAEARRSAVAAAGKVEFRQDDVATLNEKDLSEATVITIGAMSQDQLAKLAPKLAKLKPGTRIVVHEFELPGLKPTKQVEQTVNNLDHKIYLYTINK